jgi:hypothetical protein
MTMEKNGAISSCTPQGGQCCNGNACGSEKKGEAQGLAAADIQFPSNDAEAHRMGDDLTDKLNRSVQNASRSAE